MGAEKLFENRIKKWLEGNGIYRLGTSTQDMKTEPIGYWEKRFGNKMTPSGLPDLHVVIGGQSFEFEIKGPRGKASELQKHMIEQIIKSGCVGAVLYEYQEDIPDDGFEYYINYEQFKNTVIYYASKS